MNFAIKEMIDNDKMSLDIMLMTLKTSLKMRYKFIFIFIYKTISLVIFVFPKRKYFFTWDMIGGTTSDEEALVSSADGC